MLSKQNKSTLYGCLKKIAAAFVVMFQCTTSELSVKLKCRKLYPQRLLPCCEERVWFSRKYDNVTVFTYCKQRKAERMKHEDYLRI